MFPKPMHMAHGALYHKMLFAGLARTQYTNRCLISQVWWI